MSIAVLEIAAAIVYGGAVFAAITAVVFVGFMIAEGV